MGSEMCIRDRKNICVELCKSQGVMIKENVDLMNIDFIVEHCGKNIGYFITLNPNFMPEIADAMNFGLDEVVNIVLQESINGAPIFYKPNSYKYRQYPFRSLVKNLTLRQFFEEIGVTDYKEFKEYVEHEKTEQWRIMDDAPTWAKREFKEFQKDVNPKPNEDGVVTRY